MEPKNGNVIVAALDGDLTVKCLYQRDGAIFLLPENQAYQAIEIQDGQSFEIWGVATNVIHPL